MFDADPAAARNKLARDPTGDLALVVMRSTKLSSAAGPIEAARVSWLTVRHMDSGNLWAQGASACSTCTGEAKRHDALAGREARVAGRDHGLRHIVPAAGDWPRGYRLPDPESCWAGSNRAIGRTAVAARPLLLANRHSADATASFRSPSSTVSKMASPSSFATWETAIAFSTLRIWSSRSSFVSSRIDQTARSVS